MDNQHRKIKGYRELSQTEIDLMNRVKRTAENVGELVEELQSASFAVTSDQVPDPRWVSIAKTDIQKGFMALVRSIAKPDSF